LVWTTVAEQAAPNRRHFPVFVGNFLGLEALELHFGDGAHTRRISFLLQGKAVHLSALKDYGRGNCLPEQSVAVPTSAGVAEMVKNNSVNFFLVNFKSRLPIGN
jgi:hypothetical protein